MSATGRLDREFESHIAEPGPVRVRDGTDY
jgi:hypothetical protein